MILVRAESPSRLPSPRARDDGLEIRRQRSEKPRMTRIPRILTDHRGLRYNLSERAGVELRL